LLKIIFNQKTVIVKAAKPVLPVPEIPETLAGQGV